MKSYKKLLAISVLATAFLVACGDDEEVTNAPENAPTEPEQDMSTELSPDAPFNFTNFSLDVEYSGNKNLDVSYENEYTGVEASYENDLTNEKISGNDAFSKMKPMFEGFTFDLSTPNDEVIKQVKEAFEVGDDYRAEIGRAHV